MDVLLIPSVLLLLAALLTMYLRRVLRAEVSGETIPQVKKILVPMADQTLLLQLEQMLDSSCRLFWHVSLKDLLRIGCSSDWGEPEKQAQLNDREFTCVICDRETFSLLAVIDYCPAHETPAIAVDDLIPGVKIPVVVVTEADCDHGQLRPLLLSRFPDLELRLSSPLNTPSQGAQRSVFSSF
ncbi:DUF2726 domain-containing protein [Desulfuromonas acetoxidans]|uniref:DUF2726 domain-containing protein n=1 Tax=Desulfuromonas acetoxidans (strain DSM 684 / 11070) TaxID=281689 RepID=Q1K3W2_DESA6|nr:DUF2726 domain-containing protein [Desulfuromonas acetoxidans]EAT17341.1 hypothetical protein Dace_3207 [Desulfuromonas acetoxidans DSM 684]MBF0644276.1 DUF2726 domain-containing protein [Desulfuromonas acetoxidans]NVD24854.1 DUF2726 domain-containing protein [Desulfuromonas acetoxidans]NVE15155.1 DUF2726 domain-containing protein [Desulfuromonas acetoxidans]